MQVGMIGLGRMGMNMSRRLLRGHHRVVAHTRDPQKIKRMQKEGAVGAFSLDELVQQMKPPRILWLMVPAGAPVDQYIQALSEKLAPGDLIIDGGNSYYKDDLKHQKALSGFGIRYMDVGVSGGIWGLESGYCLMAGGTVQDFKKVEPLLKTLAPPKGYLLCGPVGSGHFVKMIHNGIEYGLMQAYGEGFEILEASPYKLDLAKIAKLWNQGSVVRSWLLELAERALAQDPELKNIRGYVEDSGEGRWSVQQAVETAVAAPVITQALYARFLSRKSNALAYRLLAALRNQFGGHATKPAKK